jgi:hypothetical protein
VSKNLLLSQVEEQVLLEGLPEQLCEWAQHQRYLLWRAWERMVVHSGFGHLIQDQHGHEDDRAIPWLSTAAQLHVNPSSDLYPNPSNPRFLSLMGVRGASTTEMGALQRQWFHYVFCSSTEAERPPEQCVARVSAEWHVFAQRFGNYPILQVQQNRLVTLLAYLNDVGGGGETVFPRLAKETYLSAYAVEPRKAVLQDMWECSLGKSIPPIPLGALIFYSLRPNGTFDYQTYHAGCPPDEGKVKWAVNFFVWSIDATIGFQRIRLDEAGGQNAKIAQDNTKQSGQNDGDEEEELEHQEEEYDSL